MPPLRGNALAAWLAYSMGCNTHDKYKERQIEMLANLTKAEAVYRETRWRILTGALPPGTPVNQAELAAEFQMSPTPVREALRRLESEGLVVFVAHTMVTVSPLDLKELDDLYVIRVALDSLGRTPGGHEPDRR